MHISLSGKLKYSPGKKGHAVHYHFSDQYGSRQRVSLKLTVEKPEKNKKNEWIFPTEAFSIAKSIDQEVRNKRWGTSKKVSVALSQLLARYFELDGNECAPATKEIYTTIVKKFTDTYGDIVLQKIDEKLLIDYKSVLIEKYENSKITVARDLRHLSALFAFAVRQQILDHNPVNRSVKIKKLRKPQVIIYNAEELTAIFDYMEIHYPDALAQIRFLLYTGFRENESCELRWDMIDNDLRAIKHLNIKAGREELYPCTGVLWSLITAQSKEYDPYIFRYRKRFEPYNALRRTKEKLGITKKIHIHTLKKNYSTAVGAAGTPPAFLPSLTHHTTMQVMQDSYLYINLEEKRKWLEKAHTILDRLARKWQKSETEEKIVGRIENNKAQ